MAAAVALAVDPRNAHAQTVAHQPASINDRPVAVVTGSTDGLGREVAIRLAATGAHVIVHGRNVERGAAVVARIVRDGKGSARFYRADFASLAEVRTFAETLLRDYRRIDILVNNAGVGPASPDGREVSEDGYELRFAVNYLAGYVLTRVLLPRLIASAPSRVVNVAALSQRPFDFTDVMLEHGYSGDRAYAQSKVGQIMFTFDLADELKGTGVAVCAVHPATLMATNMVRAMGIAPRTTVDAGAAAVMDLLSRNILPSGQFFDGTRPARANAQAYSAAARDSLRLLSEALTSKWVVPRPAPAAAK